MYTLYIVYSLVVVASVKKAYSGRWSITLYKLLSNVPQQLRDTKSNTNYMVCLSASNCLYYVKITSFIAQITYHQRMFALTTHNTIRIAKPTKYTA